MTGLRGQLLLEGIGDGLLSGGYGHDERQSADAYSVCDGPADLLRHLDEVGVRPSQ